VSVEWESGRRDACLLTGEGGMYNLIMAEDIDLIDGDEQEADLPPVTSVKIEREGGLGEGER